MSAIAATDLFSIPPLYTVVGQDRVTVSVKLSDDARAVVVQAVTPADKRYEQTYGLDELNKLKDGVPGLSGTAFATDLCAAFYSGKVTGDFQADKATCTVPVTNGSLQFVVPKSAKPNGSKELLTGLFEFYTMRAFNNAQPKEISKLEEQHTRLEGSIKQLQSEVDGMKESVAAARKEEESLLQKHAALQTELAAITAAQPEVEKVDIAEPDLTGSVGRLAMPDQTQREVDADLLGQIEKTVQGMDCKPEVSPCPASSLVRQIELDSGGKEIVLTLVKKLDDWDYNVFSVQDMTGRGALFYTGYALLIRHSLIAKLNLDHTRVVNFLSQVEAGYHSNPYHNSVHAADVAHVLHFILTQGQLINASRLSAEDTLAAVLAGLIHDFDHPGINNGYHTKSQSYLSILYNDRSILENHHCAEVFEMCKTDDYNIFHGLSEEQRRSIRETMIEMVLSTDMGLHAKIFVGWKKRIGVNQDLHKTKEDQRLSLSMALKMADISNCGRPQHLYLRWTVKLFEEFYLQGDAERNHGWSVSPFMDRCTPSIPSSQVAFMNFVVIPMFESIAEYLPQMHFIVDHCEENKAYWAKFEED